MDRYIVFFLRIPHQAAKPVKSFVFVFADDAGNALKHFREIHGDILTVIGTPIIIKSDVLYYTVPSRFPS